MKPSKFNNSITGCLFRVVLLSAVTLPVGCHKAEGPRMRFGAFFGSPAGMTFPEPENLGTHCFGSSPGEINGMVYTCKGGFIDIGHVREAADRTAYLRGIAYRNLIRKKAGFSFRIIEPSQYYVKVTYPPKWNLCPTKEREATVNEVSIHLGQYLAHTSLIWHEILTWYGYATVGIFPDTISSFSWEDPYSDLLGTCLGAQALRNEPQQYDYTMTKLLHHTLQELDAQPAEVAQRAAKLVEGKWYTGGFYFFVTMKKHSFDIGIDDCYIAPVLVPGICPGAVPRSYPIPNYELFEQYGFKVELEINPLVLESNRIHDSIGLARNKRIKPRVHFPQIMKQIKKQAAQSTILGSAK